MKNVMLIPLILLTLTLAGGCDEDERYVRLAQEADRRQAEQNQEIARQNQQLAEATKELVAADAKSRQEMVSLSRDLPLSFGQRTGHLPADHGHRRQTDAQGPPRRLSELRRRAMVRICLEYRFGPRSVLQPGDRFRVTGGPVYVTGDGRRITMCERGVFTFQRYCQSGSGQWLEAWRADGSTAVLYVGRPRWSNTVPNLRRRPYRVTGKVSDN